MTRLETLAMQAILAPILDTLLQFFTPTKTGVFYQGGDPSVSVQLGIGSLSNNVDEGSENITNNEFASFQTLSSLFGTAQFVKRR